MNPRILALALTVFTTVASAQTSTEIKDGESRTQVDTSVVQQQEKTSRHQLVLDFVPTLLASGVKGLGVSYHYGLTNNLSLGVFADYYETDKFNTRTYRDINWTSASTGMESKLFLSSFGKGFYLGAAATYVYLKGVGTVREIGGTAETAVEDDADKFGYLAKLGYAFQGNTLKNGSVFVVDFALNYGTGNAFEYSTISSGNQGAMRIREIRDGLGLYGGLGILF